LSGEFDLGPYRPNLTPTLTSFFLNHPLLPCGVERFFTCESIRQLVGLLGRVTGLMQGLYLHTQIIIPLDLILRQVNEIHITKPTSP